MQGAKLLLEDNTLQALHPGRQALLPIAGIEKVGVGETRPDHPFIAIDHLAGVLAFDIADEDKVRQQAARVIHDREVLLVLLHG